VLPFISLTDCKRIMKRFDESDKALTDFIVFIAIMIKMPVAFALILFNRFVQINSVVGIIKAYMIKRETDSETWLVIDLLPAIIMCTLRHSICNWRDVAC